MPNVADAVIGARNARSFRVYDATTGTSAQQYWQPNVPLALPASQSPAPAHSGHGGNEWESVMMVIREEQMRAFIEAAIRRFEHRMLSYVDDFYPHAMDRLGEQGIRVLIRYGVERAESYGIVSERDVCRYIDVMLNLGRDFDRDPGYTRFTAILADSTMTPSAKAEAMFALVS